MISAAENSNKLQKTRSWKEKSVEKLMGTKREHMGVVVCGNNEASKHGFNKLDCPPHLVLLVQEHHLNKDECFEVQEGSGIQEQSNYVESCNTIGEVFEMDPRDNHFSIT